MVNSTNCVLIIHFSGGGIAQSVQWLGYRLADGGIIIWFLAGEEMFLFSSRLSLWPTHSPYSVDPRKSFHVVAAAGAWSSPTWISRAIPPLPYMLSCCIQGEYPFPTYHIHFGSGVHQVSYPVGSKDSFSRGIQGREWSRPLPSSAEVRNALLLSTFEEQFLVHIFLHFNFSYWKSSYICVEVGVANV